MLRQLEAFAQAEIIGQHQLPVWKHLFDRGREDQVPLFVGRKLLLVSLGCLSRTQWQPLDVAARPAHGVHAVGRAILLQQSQARRQPSEILWKRDDILHKLGQPRAPR